MKRNILQIPIKSELKIKAENKAEKLGFSSVQEMIRVILTQITQSNVVKVDDICNKYKINYLGMFGSMARGDQNDNSDVDLLAKFKSNNKIGLFELDQIQREFERRYGRKVDLVTKINKYIEPDIMKDLVTIYEDNEN